jgi:hypothetical protein
VWLLRDHLSRRHVIARYVTDRRDLQFREPAFTDALLMTYPESRQLVALAEAATATTDELVQRGHDAGVLRQDFTAGDLCYADVANGLALRDLPTPSREDYDRRTRFCTHLAGRLAHPV